MYDKLEKIIAFLLRFRITLGFKSDTCEGDDFLMLYQVEDHSSKHSSGNLPKVGVLVVVLQKALQFLSCFPDGSSQVEVKLERKRFKYTS